MEKPSRFVPLGQPMPPLMLAGRVREPNLTKLPRWVPQIANPVDPDMGLMEVTTGGGGSGFTPTTAVCVTPPYAPVSVTRTMLVPRVKSIGADQLGTPCGTVTVAGTRALAVFWLVKAITTPPAGAGPSSSTSMPQVSRTWSRYTAATRVSRGGPTVSVAVRVVVPSVADTVTAMSAAATDVLIWKATELCPAGTVRVDGTEATVGLSLASVTCVPPAGAIVLRLIVPLTMLGPPTRGDATLTDASASAAGGWVVCG